MPASTLNPRPSWGAIARAQMRLLVLLQRRDLLVVGAILAVLLALAVWGLVRTAPDMHAAHAEEAVPLFPVLAVPLTLVAALWPLGVWRHDSPARRGYFWSLPASRGPHTLLRVGLGWALLLVVCLTVMALGLAVAYAFSYRVAGHTALSFPTWYLPLTSATLAYLLVSVLAVAVESPVRWVIWAAVALLGTRLVAEVTDLTAVATALDRAVNSLTTAHAGPLSDLAASAWVPHYLIWFGIGAAALVVGAFLHRDAR